MTQLERGAGKTGGFAKFASSQVLAESCVHLFEFLDIAEQQRIVEWARDEGLDEKWGGFYVEDIIVESTSDASGLDAKRERASL